MLGEFSPDSGRDYEESPLMVVCLTVSKGFVVYWSLHGHCNFERTAREKKNEEFFANRG